MVKEASPEKSKTGKNPVKEVDEILDDEDDLDGDEEVYEVERVVGHKYGPSEDDPKVTSLKYFLKWQGYGNEENTWEEENSCSCHALIASYWERYLGAGGKKTDKHGKDPSEPSAKRGGNITKKTQSKKTPSKAVSSSSSRHAEPAPLLPELTPLEDEPAEEAGNVIRGASSLKKKDRDGDHEMASAPVKKQKVADIIKREVDTNELEVDTNELEVDTNEPEDDEEALSEWTPPKEWTSWEDKVKEIQNVERSNKQMKVHLLWKNGHETTHPIAAAHQHCPLKLIMFYESHLKFTQVYEA